MKSGIKVFKKHSFRSFSSISTLSSSLEGSIIITEKPYVVLKFKVFFRRVMVIKNRQPVVYLYNYDDNGSRNDRLSRKIVKHMIFNGNMIV